MFEVFYLSSKHGPGKNILLLVCLALLCITGAELLVCRFAAPELFERLTAPVTAAVERLHSAGTALLEEAVQRIPAPPEEEEVPVEQLAGPLLFRPGSAHPGFSARPLLPSLNPSGCSVGAPAFSFRKRPPPPLYKRIFPMLYWQTARKGSDSACIKDLC